MKPEERRAKQRDNQEYFSGKISDLSRNVGYGLAALAFTLISTDSKFYQALSGDLKGLVIFAAVLAIITIILDYAQYFLGYHAATLAAENEAGAYEATIVGKQLRKGQIFCFWSKQGTAMLGALTFVFAISCFLIKMRS